MFGKIKEAIENIFPSLFIGGDIEVVFFDENRTVIVHRTGACSRSLMALKQGVEIYLVEKLLVQQPWSKNRNNIISPFIGVVICHLCRYVYKTRFYSLGEKYINTSEIK